MGDELRNLIVNYLPNSVTTPTLKALFQPFGDIESCKVITDQATGLGIGYGFVKFVTDEAASLAIQTMNGTSLENKTLKVSYAKKPGAVAAAASGGSDGSDAEANVYVAQLDKSISTGELEALFSAYGPILHTKILVDEAGNSRGAGFVKYGSRDHASLAINSLNNYTPHGAAQPLIVKFAASENKSRKAPRAQQAFGRVMRYTPIAVPGLAQVPAAYPQQYPQAMYYNPMMQQAPAGQVPAVFVYNLPADADDGMLYRLFGPFGGISSVKIARDAGGKMKGYGFVHFMKYEDAAQAIATMNGQLLGDKKLQVSFKVAKNK